jgi:hypothetical protein
MLRGCTNADILVGMSSKNALTREEAQRRANKYGMTRWHESYGEAATTLTWAQHVWGAAAMYPSPDWDGQDQATHTFVVYAWYDHAGRVRSGMEPA